MIEALILCRLLPEGRTRPSVPGLVRDLAPLLHRPLTAERVRAAIAALRDRGEIEGERLSVTDAGRERALAFLGLDALPPRWSWRTIRERALPSRALGAAPTSASAHRAVASEDRLAATLLARRFGLPERAGTTVRAALQALVCRELGHPGCATLDELASAVLSAKIGAERPLGAAALRKQVPRVLLDAANLAQMRDRLVADMLGDEPEPEPAPEPEPEPALAAVASLDEADTVDTVIDAVDPSALAQAVRRAATVCTTGRFGADKVLVHHVWRALAPPGLGRDLVAFKRALIDLNAQGLVKLARADLVQLMDPGELAQAEISVGEARFHFVRGEARAS